MNKLLSFVTVCTNRMYHCWLWEKEKWLMSFLPDLWCKLFGPWSMALVSGLRSSRWRLFPLPWDYKKREFIFLGSLFLVSCQRHSLCIAMTQEEPLGSTYKCKIHQILSSIQCKLICLTSLSLESIVAQISEMYISSYMKA